MRGVFPSTDHSFPSWDRPAACAWPSPPPCAGPSRKRAFPRANGSANSASALSLEAGGPGRGRGGSECCARVHTAHGGLEGALLREPGPPLSPRPPAGAGQGLRFSDRRVFQAQPLAEVWFSVQTGVLEGNFRPGSPRTLGPSSANGTWLGFTSRIVGGTVVTCSLEFSHMGREPAAPPIVLRRKHDSLPVAL